MAEKKPAAADVFDVERIAQLVELMKKHDLAEIDLRQSEQQIRLLRGAPVMAAPAMVAPGMVAAPVAPVAPLPPPVAASGEAAAPAAEANIHFIKSPMVGTFYSKANPDADAYVKVGDRVEPETVVCIVEAMKVFNEIQAEVSGVIVEVLVQNEDPVDYGKPLFKVDTSK